MQKWGIQFTTNNEYLAAAKEIFFGLNNTITMWIEIRNFQSWLWYLKCITSWCKSNDGQKNHIKKKYFLLECLIFVLKKR